MDNIKVIGFDADDTLWVCEPIFREAEKRICELLSPWISPERLLQLILEVHVGNLNLYGYGIKGYILSLTEAVLHATENRVPQEILSRILQVGKEMLQEPVRLINRVDRILPVLKEQYKLIVVTKGDLLDQQRKIETSGLLACFDDVEIMSDKTPEAYQKMFNRMGIQPSEFMMVGNSLKSDILPVIELGCHGVHIPYEITWAHERVEEVDRTNPLFHEIRRMEELYDLVPIS